MYTADEGDSGATTAPGRLGLGAARRRRQGAAGAKALALAGLQHRQRTTLQANADGVECLYLTVYNPATKECQCPPGTVFIPKKYCMVPPPPGPPQKMPTGHIAIIAAVCGAALTLLVGAWLWWRRRKARRQQAQAEAGPQQAKAASRSSRDPEKGLKAGGPLEAGLSAKQASRSTSSSSRIVGGATSVRVQAGGTMGTQAATSQFLGAAELAQAELAPLPEMRSMHSMQRQGGGQLEKPGGAPAELAGEDADLAEQAAMAQDLMQMELLLMQEMQLLMQQQRQQQQGGPGAWTDNLAAL